MALRSTRSRGALHLGAVLQRRLRASVQTFEVAKIPVSNVEAMLTGAAHAAEIVVVGAHYDTVAGCPGANDNGTGVAAVLELAQRFSRRPQPRTIRFVAFVNEEPPFFRTAHMGSVVSANAAKDRGDRDHGDAGVGDDGLLLGREREPAVPAGDRIALPGRRELHRIRREQSVGGLLLQSRQASSGGRDFHCRPWQPPDDVPGVGWSDHWAFWQAGYPAMMVTDTAPFRYPWYHTAEDTPDKIDYEKLADVVDGLEAVIESLAG